MGLNPSCNLKEGLKPLGNLGDPPFRSPRRDKALSELVEAGIPRGSSIVTTKEIEVYKPDSEAAKLARCGISFPGACKRSETEWVEVHEVEARAFGWKFYRCWYYWNCQAETGDHALPEETARKLNASHFDDVRVGGFAGGQEVSGPVMSYDVDTMNGLKDLVFLLRQRYEEWEAEEKRRFEAEMEQLRKKRKG